MTNESRMTLERAAGVIEGVASVTDDKIAETLFNVCEMLDAVLQKEGDDG